MMMRNKSKERKYFEDFVKSKSELISIDELALKNNEIKGNNLFWVKLQILRDYSDILVASYSKGVEIQSLHPLLKTVLDKLQFGWNPLCTKIDLSRSEDEEIYLDQYMVEPYERMLRILSLAFLLKVSDDDFMQIVNIIDRDNISDNLYEFIIKARVPDRGPNRPEEYDKEKYVVLKVYDKLRNSTESIDKESASTLVKQFLDKDFYHKHSGFYNSHKQKGNSYYGYWSFEAAAITCIMGLDDGLYRNHQYYPKDLVDYYREN